MDMSVAEADQRLKVLISLERDLISGAYSITVGAEAGGGGGILFVILK